MNKSTLASHGMTLTQIGQAIVYAVVDNGGTDEDAIRILSNENLRNKIAGLILEGVSVAPNKILRRILETETITFDACDGTRTMANAKEVFTGYIDGDWKNYGLCNPGPATIATPAHVYELVKKEKFKGMFQSLPFSLESMCVTESQYVGFAEKYPHLLGGYGTFMLVKKDASLPAVRKVDGVENFDNVFVATARRRSGGLNSRVHYFENDYDWHADHHHRVIVPQLGT